ncbi:MAG TPA: hypothetical protein VHM88_21315, partial [Candidatus Acidoferrales bacterium]|nr:hypothetical protein [Candidatus Acidoferrales bacterium]
MSTAGSGGSASLSGSVQFGSIVGSLTASGANGSVANDGAATFDGVWQDSLTVTSNTLANGTPVDLLFTLSFSSVTTCQGVLANTGVQAIGAFSATTSAGPQQITATNTT